MSHLLKFYELPAEEQAAITKAIAAGGNDVEIYTPLHATWYPVDIMSGGKIYVDYCYRLKPKMLNIPWEIIDKKFNYAVAEEDGSVWFGHEEFTPFSEDSEVYGEYWKNQKDYLRSCVVIDTTDVYYKTSQTKRP